ncbi:hypothetical protein OSB04_014339 [Centaurea solstitialis]|uniref:F-box protein n=1 Tax=Centaurea solstitialis TaxID=347529 RepID=A0AA38WHM7_9ASTR|nr:hypothetical protein OSB04_014339 [Centaurea solstitialis]
MQQQKQWICLPPLSVNYYPWLVAFDHTNGDQIFYNIHDPLSCYRCRIPELVGKHIQACFHGWVVLSDPQQTHWFLWNPTAPPPRLICLPRLLLKQDPRNIPYAFPIKECYLSSPPDVPGSILLLIRCDKPNFVLCRLDSSKKRKTLRWIEMSYAEQLSSITGYGMEMADTLACLTCYNGEVYATVSTCVVKIHIVVKEKSVMISLVPFVNLPKPPNPSGVHPSSQKFLIGSSLELLVIFVGVVLLDGLKLKPVNVCLYKLDLTSMVWVEKEDLKDTVLYVDMVGGYRSSACAVVSEFGGYVHILHKIDKVVYSYNVKDKTISKSFMRCLDWIPSHVAVWQMPGPGPEFRLQSDGKCKAKKDGMVVRSTNVAAKEVVQEEIVSNLLNLPFHALEMILEFCVGVEYLNFRATCKLCHLAAPLINRKVPQRRLKTYSLVSSPWLMVFDKRGGIITFTDPMFGDNYFIRAKIVSDSRIACSRYGWLLLLIGDYRLVFFNPFTSEIRELPARDTCSESFCFSAPPTSPDCIVVGFSGSHVFFHFVVGEPIWYELVLDISFYLKFPTFCGRDVYGFCNGGRVGVFREFGQCYVWEIVADRLPTSSRYAAVAYFLTTCNQHLLLLMVEDFGEAVEVFKLTKELEWEKVDGLGRLAIYVCDALSTCLCMAAKTPEMENKIFFSRLHSKTERLCFTLWKHACFTRLMAGILSMKLGWRIPINIPTIMRGLNQLGASF